MSDLKTISVAIGPQVWGITYAADELDTHTALQRWNAAMERLLAGDEAGAVELFADLLYALARGWDIVDSEGAPYPLKRWALPQLGPVLLVEIARQITNDMMPAAAAAHERVLIEHLTKGASA